MDGARRRQTRLAGSNKYGPCGHGELVCTAACRADIHRRADTVTAHTGVSPVGDCTRTMRHTDRQTVSQLNDSPLTSFVTKHSVNIHVQNRQHLDKSTSGLHRIALPTGTTCHKYTKKHYYKTHIIHTKSSVIAETALVKIRSVIATARLTVNVTR